MCSWPNCDRPTRNGAWVCDSCLDIFTVGLRELSPHAGAHRDPLSPSGREVVPGLWDELQITIVGQRGVDYGRLGGGGSGSGERGVVAVGIELNQRASDLATDLERALRHLRLMAESHRLTYLGDAVVRPRSRHRVGQLAEWLILRVDAMALVPEVAEFAARVLALIEQARWVIDRPEARYSLARCPVEGCEGNLSAAPDDTYARCRLCRAAVEAQPLRDAAMTEKRDAWMTPKEIARFATGLGFRSSSEKARQRTLEQISKWGLRNKIQPLGYSNVISPEAEEHHRLPDRPRTLRPAIVVAGAPCKGRCWHDSCALIKHSRGDPLYLFGEVYDLLTQAEAEADDRTSKPITIRPIPSKGA